MDEKFKNSSQAWNLLALKDQCNYSKKDKVRKATKEFVEARRETIKK